jgi:hypothetical protein
MRDPHRQRVYDAERIAFENTALADRIAEGEIKSSYREVIDSPWWIWRDVEVVSARADMVSHGGKANRNRIWTSAGRIHQYTVSHELAHVLVSRLGLFDPGHGAAFRRTHLHTVHAIYGEPYRDLLLQAYTAFELPIDLTPLELPAAPTVPIINIDALSIATAPTGGWRRPS